MVSRYTDLVVSSWTILLELTLEIPGAVISPMDITSTDVSWLTGMGSGIAKQATTPAKPQGRVDGHTSVNALVGGGDAGGVGALGGWTGDLTRVGWEGQQALPLGLDSLIGWGISPVATMAWDGCSTLSHTVYSSTVSSGIVSDVWCSTGTSVVLGSGSPLSPSSSGRSTPWKTFSSVKDR